MPERQISAKEILRDVREGLDDTAIMRKYKLSPKGLHNVYNELVDCGYLERVGQHYVVPTARRISTREIVAEIRRGVSNEELMRRHKLTEAGLQNAFKLLVDTRALGAEEIAGRQSLRFEAVVPQGIREMERYYLDFDLPIIDTGPPEIQGRVRDMSEKGVGVAGIAAKVGELKTLLVLHEEFVVIEPFLFEAQCRWVRESESDGSMTAGFQIKSITSEDLRQLKQLLQLVTFGG
jgi:uncharacterized protein (DUF433 family)